MGVMRIEARDGVDAVWLVWMVRCRLGMVWMQCG